MSDAGTTSTPWPRPPPGSARTSRASTTSTSTRTARATLSYGSARVIVDVEVFDEDQSVVHVRARCVTGATRSPELYHVATNRADLGHFRVVDEDDGTVAIEFSHCLIGEFLNPAELRLTVVAVAFTADRFDDDLAARFGGVVHDAAGNLGLGPGR